MLTALTSGKAGRINIPGSEDSISWREVFRRSEDLLTAVFFGRLRFLSDEGMAQVMGLLIGSEAANKLGSFQEMEFWPHLTGLKDRSWVEPDIILHFENATLIIEVKPPFGGGQYLEQWQAEVHAFVAECIDGNRATPEVVHFVALGQNICPIGKQSISEFDTQDCFNLSVHAQEWESIVTSLPNWSAECPRTDAAVFEDWTEAFELFNLQPPLVQRHWSDLLVFSQNTPLSPKMQALLQESQTAVLLPSNTIKPERGPKAWQPLLDFTQNHPLELHTWKWHIPTQKN